MLNKEKMETKETNKDNEAECEHMLENGRNEYKNEAAEKDLKKEDKGLPIDRGWAWAVLAGKAI